MILRAFSNYLKQFGDNIIRNETTAVKVLYDWIKFVLNKKPQNHVEKIVHREIKLVENENGDLGLAEKSESGRVLINALHNYALSYENFLMSRWLEDKKPHDFNLWAETHRRNDKHNKTENE